MPAPTDDTSASVPTPSLRPASSRVAGPPSQVNRPARLLAWMAFAVPCALVMWCAWGTASDFRSGYLVFLVATALPLCALVHPLVTKDLGEFRDGTTALAIFLSLYGFLAFLLGAFIYFLSVPLLVLARFAARRPVKVAG
ncbi:hypothetical protein [Yinghuangia seranimata]|uniref:hypothetical protein n=1 Tax=Yinghuangia seranimata TaxID=408067 RepID=UPI00248B5679|nr:hypothetical protein [Yinghuangia seranimata]MDI2128204.1 hypothetical protein [Yinghuangia seranimata]